MLKSRFLWSHFFTHPGTWMGLALFSIGIGIVIAFLAPLILSAIAPTLLIIAGLATSFALVSLPFYIARYINRLKVEQASKKEMDEYGFFFILLDHFGNWLINHPGQFLFVFVGIMAFTMALWLTVSFFTGGSTLLMAPVFAAIAAPLVANSTIGLTGLPLALAVTSGAIFTVVPLFVTNVGKRFLALFGSDSQKIDDDVPDNPMDDNRDRIDSVSLDDGPLLNYSSPSPSFFYQITHFSGMIPPDEPKTTNKSQLLGFY